MQIKLRARLLAASIGTLAVLAQPAAVFAEDLADAIALAYDTNPTILTQRSVLRNADEAYFRTRAGLGPTVGADITVRGNTDNDLINSAGGNSSSSITAGATATQTIYSGGRLSANMQAQRASLASSRESLRSVEQRVLQQVVDAYTGVRRAEQQLAIAEEQVTVLERQAEEASARFRFGAGTVTDESQALARLAQARTSRTGAQNTLANARAQYVTVVGKAPEDLDPEPSLAPFLPNSLDGAFLVAQENSPALRQAYLAERQSAAQIQAARAARLPDVNVNVGVSSGFANGLGGGGFNNGTAGLTSGVSVNVPLFAGRTTSSQIRSAIESNRQDQIQIESQLRTLNQSVTQAWNALIAARAQIESQQEAVRATRLATEGVREEQQVGFRTTLDVLNAEQEQRQAEQALVNAQFQEYTASVALLNAMGVLAPGMFGAEVALYDPEEHFDEVNGRGLPWVPLIERLDTIGVQPIPERIPGPGEVVPEIDLP